MSSRLKVLLVIITSLIYYIGMDFSEESFFNFYSLKFYLKILISLTFGIILSVIIKGGKKNKL